MDRRAATSLLVLISVLLVLSGPVVAAEMKATFAAGVGVADTAVLRQLMRTSRLEDSVAPELPVDVELHRRVLAGGSLKPPVSKADAPACVGPCPPPGLPYTRGCEKVFDCVPGHG